jgi:hypothetical protein
MNDQLTREQAIAFGESRAWESMSEAQRARFQIEQNRLCMPFDVFHRAVEKTLGRPVWTHEFGLNRDGLRAELAGTGPAPTMKKIIAMLPADKVLLVALASGEASK